jgi:hypothetical protein
MGRPFMFQIPLLALYRHLASLVLSISQKYDYCSVDKRNLRFREFKSLPRLGEQICG